MTECILLTGATGALGSMLLRRLSDQGRRVVCLVRAENDDKAWDRIRAITGDKANISVIRGDITDADCGISEASRSALAGQVTSVLHCAASVDFLKEEATHLTNVSGVRNVLALMERLDIQQIWHVSTAYVVGDGHYLEEQFSSSGRKWNNPYEASKFIGERMIRDWALDHPERHFKIFRPSILVGCEDGTTCTFDGYYRVFEPIHRIAESLRQHQGKPLPPGIHVSADGSVRLPLAMLIADTRLNYVPIDWVADMITAAVDTAARNEIYNLVHHDPIRSRNMMSWSLDHLKVEGVSIYDTQYEKDIAIEAQTPVLHRLQRRVDSIHDAYAPYVVTDPRFQMETASRNLGQQFRLPPIVDQGFLQRLLNYAIDHNWGKKKRSGDIPA